ncbi:MAG: glycosyltransferase [Planctomycetaceae bacterium]
MSHPIRIAYVVHTFDPGGLERCVARLVDGLDRRRFAPSIVCLDRSGAASNWIESPDVAIVELRKGASGVVGLVRRLADAFRGNGVEIAHSHNWGTLLETAVACRLVRPKVRHVHAERGTVLGQPARSAHRRRLRAVAMRHTLSCADVVMSNSIETARRVGDVTGIPVSRIRIIPNGLNAPLDDPARIEVERRRIRGRLGIDDDAVLFGSVGRLVSVKDFPTAIRAVTEAAKSGMPAHLLLVGDGPEQDRLRATAIQTGSADRVHFVGEQAEVGPWYAAMDAYVNTSLSEGMSQSVVEAMAMRLPLVVTDVGDHRRLAESDGGCGRVAEAGDVAALSDAMCELAGSRRLRKELGRRAAGVHAAGHSLATMIARYERLYESLSVQGEVHAASIERERAASPVGLEVEQRSMMRVRIE